MTAMPPESLEFIVNHVILPPRLPQKAEDALVSRAAERSLISLLSTHLGTYRAYVNDRSSRVHAVWPSIKAILDRCALLMSSYALTTDLLVCAFQSLDTDGKSYNLPPGASKLTVALSQPLNPSDIYQSSECGAYPAQKRGHGCL